MDRVEVALGPEYASQPMVADDFHIVGITVFPDETDSPLVIDPYAVLSRSAAPEFFGPVGRGDAWPVPANAGERRGIG